MNAEARATRAVARLLAEIRLDVAVMDERTARLAVAPALVGPRTGEVVPGAFDAYVAHEIERWYSALEAIGERVARGLDDEIPSGSGWHRELLERMTLTIPGFRPALIDTADLAELTRTLSLRHFLRHAYRVELDPEELERHRARVLALHPRVRATLDAFMTFLEAMTAE